MIEVNLIPDVKRELIRAQIQRNAVISIAIIAAIAAGVVAILVAAYVYGAQALMMRSANKLIDEQYSTLSEVPDLDKMLTIQNQLGTVSSLDKDKYMTSRIYGLLNITAPKSPHKVTISSVAIEPSASEEENEDETASDEGTGPTITIEGQARGGYASLEVFEKMIASTVLEYQPLEGYESTGELSCGNEDLECRYVAVGGGDRSEAIVIEEMSYGEDQEGVKTLYFKLSFVAAPEVLSNQVTNVRMKIGKDGDVTDSYLGVPRSIFEERPVSGEGSEDGE